MTRADLDRARTIADDPVVRDCLYLVARGVPFDIAFCLDEPVRLAWCVILGELDGGDFDWGALRWRAKE